MRFLIDMNLSPRWVGCLDAAAELEQGALLAIDVNRTRLRLLPLKTSK